MSEEFETIILQLDIKPMNIGEYFTYYVNRDFHIDYICLKRDYEQNKDKILEEICYRLKFKQFNNIPEEIQNADILIVIDRCTNRILSIIKQGFIHIDKIKDLTRINNIDYLQHLLKNIVGEEE